MKALFRPPPFTQSGHFMFPGSYSSGQGDFDGDYPDHGTAPNENFNGYYQVQDEHDTDVNEEPAEDAAIDTRGASGPVSCLTQPQWIKIRQARSQHSEDLPLPYVEHSQGELLRLHLNFGFHFFSTSF